MAPEVKPSGSPSPAVVAGVLFVLAAAARLLHLLWLNASHPEILAHPVVDAAYYHRWALDILEGGPLSRQVFFMHPLYPHFVAALYALFGPEPLAVGVAQALLGAGGVLLFHRLCGLWFAPRVALVSALVLALYRPLLLDDALLETVELGLFFLLLALLLAATAPLGHTRLRQAAAGLCFFLAVLCRGNLLLCAPLLLLAPMLAESGPWRERLRAALPMAGGMVLVLLAVGLRNQVVAGEWVMTMTSGGPNLYLSNHRDAAIDSSNPPAFVRSDPRLLEGDFRREAERLSGHPLTAAEVSSFWTGRALAEIAAHPGRAAGRYLRRLGAALGGYEIANNYDLDYLAGLTPLGRVPLPGFLWLVGLAAVGAGLCWQRRGELFLLYGLGAGYLLSLGLFFQTSRMRIYLVPFLIPFAVEAMRWLWVAGRERRFVLATGAGAAAALLTAVSASIAPETVRTADRSQALSSHAVALMAVDRIAEARALQRRALALQPSNPFLLVNAGDAALRARDSKGALLACGRAAAVRPMLATAHNCRGIALARRGALGEAEQAFRLAANLDREGPESRLNLAVLLAQTGRRDQADRILSDLARAFPDHVPTRRSLEMLRRSR